MRHQAPRDAVPPPTPREPPASLRLDPRLDLTNGSRAWVWIRHRALEEGHVGWLIQTGYQHLLRHVARLNSQLEEARERGFTALDGCRFEIRARRLRP